MIHKQAVIILGMTILTLFLLCALITKLDNQIANDKMLLDDKDLQLQSKQRVINAANYAIESLQKEIAAYKQAAEK